MAALTTPISLVNRGLTANTGVTTSLYPHSQQVNEAGLKVRSVRISGPDATNVKTNGASTVANIATSDVLNVISIPAGSFVLGVAAKVVIAEGGTCTFSIGSSGQTAGYISAANGNTTTNVFSWDESPASLATVWGVGHFYSADGTIDFLLASGTFTTAVIDISVSYIDMIPRVS
jgi:hypothetical protein